MKRRGDLIETNQYPHVILSVHKTHLAPESRLRFSDNNLIISLTMFFSRKRCFIIYFIFCKNLQSNTSVNKLKLLIANLKCVSNNIF